MQPAALKRSRNIQVVDHDPLQKGPKLASHVNPFDRLCNDLVLFILGSLSSRAQSPSDLIAITLTCKRFRELGMQATVLTNASKKAVAVTATTWCTNAQNFLMRCAESGNIEAAFTLGMIEFYCMDNKIKGIRLLAKAASARHGEALFALAVLQLNGSRWRGDVRAGVALCSKAAMAGCMEATRELGHFLKEGGSGAAARQLLQEANRREAMLFMRDIAELRGSRKLGAAYALDPEAGVRALELYNKVVRLYLVSDYGCPLPLGWLLQSRHPAHRFLAEWRALHSATAAIRLLRYCSNALCGRSETRPREFRQCAACGSAFYCSRSCQSLDWKLRHLLLCCSTMPSLI